MRVVVIGAGAWGLPAAAELARRGHQVELVDAFGVGNPVGSSGGASRIWRLTHGNRHGVRLALRSVGAWRRLEARADEQVLLERGLLWRGPDASDIAAALTAEGVPHTWVEPDDVGAFLPTMVAGDDAAIWQPTAGPVLVERAQAAGVHLLQLHGGCQHVGRWVDRVDVRTDGVRAVFRDGEFIDADVAVLAPGPWAQRLLATVGVELALEPVLEQVGYFHGPADWSGWPCVVDTQGEGLGVYGMATPGLGYKLGHDLPGRRFVDGDEDRSPDPDTTRDLEQWVATHLRGLVPTVVRHQVCSWTNSPDGWFVVDRVHGGQVVLACGDSGQGFKFSALMGELLADLAEGTAPDLDPADLEVLSLARFAAS